MRVGLHALGIGAGARPEVVAAVARAADAAGFATLWAGEHVVMVDRSASRYPYSDSGEIAVPADADWLDPFVCLSFAAAATRRIGLATGVLLLPEHNPVVVAKQAASLDVMSGGRFTLGVGVGWSAEEFAALGVPFERRGARTAEYVAALRELWGSDHASFAGRFVNFDSIRVYPKPVRDRRLPVVFGGNSARGADAGGRARRRLVWVQPRGARARGRPRGGAARAMRGRGTAVRGADRRRVGGSMHAGRCRRARAARRDRARAGRGAAGATRRGRAMGGWPGPRLAG